MSLSLAHYLKDFSEQPSVSSASFADIEPDLGEDLFPALSQDLPVVDVAAERREAYAEGYDAAMREFHKQQEAERETLASAHLAEVTQMRDQHEAETSVLIATRIRTMADVIAAAISEQTAQVIAPVLSQALAEKAIADMVEMIRAAVLEGEATQLTVRGPATLFELLKTELGDDAPALRHVATADLDLSVDIDETVLVTRLSAWAASLQKVLG